MIGPPHSQLVPTSPIWSQLAPRSLTFSCQGVGVYRIQEICNCCCPHSKIMMWCWLWCVPSQEPKQSKLHHVFTHSWQWSMLNGGVCLTYSSWARQKSWTCSCCVSSMRNRKYAKPLGLWHFWWCVLWSAELEAQPSPIQMLRQHATSRQWFMQNEWQGQWKLMNDSLVYLH